MFSANREIVFLSNAFAVTFRDDYQLIRLDPPIIAQTYGVGGIDIDKVIVATRHKGDSLFPINKWPVFVHVARVLPDHPAEREVIHNGEFEEIAWAEVIPDGCRRQRKDPVISEFGGFLSRSSFRYATLS